MAKSLYSSSDILLTNSMGVLPMSLQEHPGALPLLFQSPPQTFVGITVVTLPGASIDPLLLLRCSERWAAHLGVVPARGRILQSQSSTSTLEFPDFSARMSDLNNSRSQGYWWAADLHAGHETVSGVFNVNVCHYLGGWFMNVALNRDFLDVDLSDILSWLGQVSQVFPITFGSISAADTATQSLHVGLGQIQRLRSHPCQDRLCSCNHSPSQPSFRGGIHSCPAVEVFPLTLLADHYLKKEINGDTLAHWIQQSPRRGRLDFQGRGLWAWIVDPQDINSLRAELRRECLCMNRVYGDV